MKKLLAALRKLLKPSKGFTLIELLVVIAVLGVLLVGSIVAINPVQKINQAKDANAKASVDQVASALQAYYTSNQIYPANLAALQTAGELRSIPVGPNNVALTYVGPSATPNVAVHFELLQPADGTVGEVWCWQSSTGRAQELTNAAACTAP